jgi:putative transposase
MGVLSPVKVSSRNSFCPLIAKIQLLLSRDLALANDFLRHENQILRRKLRARVTLTKAERRVLLKYGLRIKDRLAEVISIASPATLLAWNRRQQRDKWTQKPPSAQPGRPCQSAETEALIIQFAEENPAWGYTRITGELKKVGHPACPSYVRDVLRRHGLAPAPPAQARYARGESGCTPPTGS